MEIRKTTGEAFDLAEDAKASVDVEIFSDNVDNVVTILKGMEMPSTDKNLNLLEPDLAGTPVVKHDIEMRSEHDPLKVFYGVMNVESQTYNTYNEAISVEIVDQLKDLFDNMDINIGSLGDASVFDWDFSSGTDAPLDLSQTQWFLTAPDCNGYSKAVDDMEDIPLYPVKFITGQTQMYWTISVYGFIKKVFDYYSVSYDFNATDKIFGTVNFDDVYIFIPAEFECDDDEERKRTVRVDLGVGINTGAGQSTGMSASDSTDDVYEMRTLATNRLIGTCDTVFNFGISGNLTITCNHDRNAGGNVYSYHATGNDVRVIVRVEKNQKEIKTFDIGSVYSLLPTTGINKTSTITGVSISDTEDIEFLATDEIECFYELEFKNYQFWDYTTSGTNLKTLNGIYSRSELTGMGFSYIGVPTISSVTSAGLMLTMTPVKNINPCRRENVSGTAIYDVVNLDYSLAKTGVDVKTLMADIVKRFNLGFWIDSDNDIHVTNYNNRFEATAITNIYSAKGEKIKVNYIKTGTDEFEYKNSVGKVATLKQENFDGTKFNTGDVLKFSVGGEEKSIAVRMDSMIATHQVTGDRLIEDVSDLLATESNIYFWGIGNNKQLDQKDKPKMIGFAHENRFDIRLPYVQMLTVGGTNNSYVSYVPNGEITLADDYVAHLVHYPYYLKDPSLSSSDSVSLGTERGLIDEAGEMYGNFEFLFDVAYASKIEIECVINHAQFNEIIDGNAVYIESLFDGESKWKPLSIEGFLFDREYSVVLLTLKRFSY